MVKQNLFKYFDSIVDYNFFFEELKRNVEAPVLILLGKISTNTKKIDL